jgi:SAM-dependent methyltransferase
MSQDASRRDGEVVRPLDPATLETFHKKGDRGAVKVRRVIQATKDLLRRDLRGARVLDLGCAEGVYAIEAGLRGARVLAVDGRSERLDDGRAAARRLGLADVEFRVADVRRLSRAEIGGFDVVFFLGLQYHLAAADVFDVMRNVFEMCDGLTVLDTHVAPAAVERVEHAGLVFEGESKREHDSGDDADTKRARLGASLDNPRSFWFTKPSLLRLLRHVGFTSVHECHVPIECDKRADRVTLVAVKGSETRLSSYPWINGLSEEEIAARMAELPAFKGYWQPSSPAPDRAARSGWLRAVKRALRGKRPETR